MKIPTHAAAVALAGALAVTAANPSFANNRAAATHASADYASQPAQQGYAYEPARGHFAPGYTGYGRQAYNPEQPTDPDPRIGGAFKMSTDR